MPDCFLLFLNNETIDYQGVYSGAIEAAHCFPRGADNRLPKKIEGRVDKNGDAGLLPEFIEQPPEERIGLPADRMHASHSTRKPGSRDRLPLVISDA